MKTDQFNRITIWLLVAAFAVFFALPFAGLVERAIRDGRFFELATGDAALAALRLSLITSAVTVAIAIILGTPTAYLLARRRFPGSNLIDALLDLPIVLPPTVAGVALLTAFGRRGLLGQPLEEWTGISFVFQTSGVILAQTLVAAPFYVRAAKNGFESVDRQLEAVAYTLGASRARTFFQVVVPQASGALFAGLVLCWARALGELGATLIFAGSLQGKTQTMPLAILGALEGSSLGLSGAIVLSIILLAAALALLLLFRLVPQRLGARR